MRLPASPSLARPRITIERTVRPTPSSLRRTRQPILAVWPGGPNRQRRLKPSSLAPSVSVRPVASLDSAQIARSSTPSAESRVARDPIGSICRYASYASSMSASIVATYVLLSW
jgi:hypothetical protein